MDADMTAWHIGDTMNRRILLAKRVAERGRGLRKIKQDGRVRLAGGPFPDGTPP